MSLKEKVAETFDSFADILEFKGDNPFKINAFRNGAAIIRDLEGDLEEMVGEGSIKNVKGIGKGLLAVIYDIQDKGYSADYENLIAEIPPGILDFMNINGLGVKKVKIIHDSLGISSMEELELACKSNRLAAVKGFGEKTQKAILDEIERIKSAKNFTLLDDAKKKNDLILTALEEFNSIKKVQPSAEYRRSLEVISKLEFVIFVTSIEEFTKELKSHYFFDDSPIAEDCLVETGGLSKTISYKCFMLKDEYYIPVYFICTESLRDYENLLFFTTGSPEFIKMAEASGKVFNTEHESGIFTALNMSVVIPEMREKEYFSAPENLRKNSELGILDFRGLLHFHTGYSDGKNTLGEMAQAAKDGVFTYLAVCDHSKSAFYANGLSEARVLEQKKEIERVSRELDIPVFHGVESDILKDGELDYDEGFMKNFQFVVASVHSRFKLSEAEMTSRIIKAVENPNTDLLGHPTGRLLLQRSPYHLDIKKVIDACAGNSVAIEINASPNRLDLDWRMIYYAREKGCLFSINPDAHSILGIDEINYGISVARKGGLQPEEVINCMDLEDFRKFLTRKVKREISY
ncbi:MAG: histidinol-phosphatase [Ignavibacteria bacterium]|jgi:DNA polymerase (family 10)|nr:histidinol-phosphatase [Ignavibacteria bacterium]MCU7501504.1 histidinol-phosphatase [Ignavibacteria bacterium]MCU7515980.1 histidinol-phosphatase [Ignavibacteria bacterium]